MVVWRSVPRDQGQDRPAGRLGRWRGCSPLRGTTVNVRVLIALAAGILTVMGPLWVDLSEVVQVVLGARGRRGPLPAGLPPDQVHHGQQQRQQHDP